MLSTCTYKTTSNIQKKKTKKKVYDTKYIHYLNSILNQENKGKNQEDNFQCFIKVKHLLLDMWQIKTFNTPKVQSKYD